MVIGIDAPDRRLAKHFVFIQSDQRTQRKWRQLRQPQRAAGHIARKTAVRGQLICQLGRQTILHQLRQGFWVRSALGQSLRLGLHIEQHHALVLLRQRQALMTLTHADEIHGHQMAALVQQLEIRMLSIVAQAAPQNGRCRHGTQTAVQVHALAVGLHVLLL